MKKNILLFIVLLITIDFYSQSNTGVILYGHKQSMGMGGPFGVDYNASLIFNNSESLYTYAKDSLEGGHVNKSVMIRKDKTHMIVKPKRTSKNGYRVNVKLGSKMFSRNKVYSYVKEEIPKIQWEIMNETKKIGNIVCHKAKGYFRGREYTAWFTNSIPLAFGPWKLQGLPGLILEAYDTNKEVYFYFKSIKYPISSNTNIAKIDPNSENKKWITLNDYKNLLNDIYNNNIQNGRLVAESYDAAGVEEASMPKAHFFMEVFE